MAIERAKRQLTAILALDAAGYSRLMGVDEEGTHARLKAVLGEVVEPRIAGDQGHVIKRTGDGLLAAFGSTHSAARVAIAVQEEMAERNRDLAGDRRIDLRIGINVGDVIVDGGEIYGDGVNIAVRLEGIAEPGEIYVSEAVAEQIRGALATSLVDLGERQLKNISQRVRVLRLGPRRAAGSGAARVLGPDFGPRQRPAIAVLPFVNMSGDPEQEYFADGLTEDLITAVASWRSFPVIARNSVFTFKGRSVDVRQIGRELGAQYVLEGSVRREQSRVRITAQLIEAESNVHVFADRYERDLVDVFAVQDDIATRIIGALEPELLRVESQRAASAPQLFSAYDHLLRGLWHHYRYTDEDNSAARRLFEEALRLDPSYAQAAAALATATIHRVMHGWAAAGEPVRDEALAQAQRAVALDPRAPHARFALGLCHLHAGRIAQARGEMEEVIRLHPSHAVAWVNLGNIHNYFDEPARALEAVAIAHRLSPNDPRHFLSVPALAGGLYLLGRYEEAVEEGRLGHLIKPDYVAPLRYVAAGLGQLGRSEEAAPFLAALAGSDGNLAGTERYLRTYYVATAALERILDGLRKAGMR